MSAPRSYDVTVKYATSIEEGDTAEAEDFVETKGTLTFKANATGDDLTQKVSVPIVHDSINEGDETFTLTLSEPGGTRRPRLANTTATGTIIDNDGPAELSVGDESGTEGSMIEFKVRASTMALADMTVKYEILVGEGDTAAEANDFAFSDEYPMSGTLVFEHGMEEETEGDDAEEEGWKGGSSGAVGVCADRGRRRR